MKRFKRCQAEIPNFVPVEKSNKPPMSMKPNRRSKIAMLTALLLFFTAATSTVKAQLTLKFTTYTQVTGTTPVLNARYVFNDVSTGTGANYDCIVTIAALSNATVSNIDETTFGVAERFQPVINQALALNGSGYARFNFQLIAANSYSTANPNGTPVIPTEPIWFRAYDVDGSVNADLREFVEVNNVFTGSWVDNPTNLIAKTPIQTGGDSYIASNNTNGPNISEDGIYAFNGFIYANTTGAWSITGGSVTDGGGTTNPASNFARNNSWSFDPIDVLPGIDFGDAPASYNAGSTPIEPAFHVVPTVATNIRVFLGSAKPDVDYDPSGNVTATTDDANNAIDDEDGFTGTFFPRYSGTGNYTVNVNVTNTSGANAFLYGYIDFNGDGDFLDANEKSNQVIVANNAALQTVTVTFPSGFTYTATAANRYARFRIGSVDAQVNVANSKALSGEVEDYRFNTFVNITGTVFDDANGLVGDNNVNGTAIGNPASTQLYAILVNSANQVVQSVAVSTTAGSIGTYTFTNGGAGSTYTVVLSTTAGTVGNAPPAASLPAGWVNTGEALGTTGNDGTVDGRLTIAVTNAVDIANANFGIDAIPVGSNKTLTAVPNPGGTGTTPIAASTFTASDAEDASSGYATNLTGRTVTLVSSATGTVYYNGTAVPTGAGTTITSFNPALVTFDPASNGATSGTFTYSVLDNAGKASVANTITVQFTDLTISGTVYDDPNTTAAVDGTATGTIGANTLYAVLLNGTTVVSRKAVAANGTYSFGTADGITAGSNYSVIITNGATAVTPVLAAGTVYNSETDGTVNGSITVNNVTANVVNQNFGIDQLPTVNNYTATAVANPGGTATVTVAAAAFTGSDPEDASAGYATNLTGRKVTLASGTNGTVYYNGTAVPTGAGTTITTFNPALVTFDPADGAVSGTFTYNVFDNADKPSATAATVTVPFSDLVISGTVYNDPNTTAAVDGTPAGVIGSNTLYAVLLNGTTVVSRKQVAANGTYSFGTADGVTSGSSYSVIVTNGATAVTPVLVGAAYNSETDGTINGSISINNITANVTGQNFGIDQLPTVNSYTAASVVNPGGTATVLVPAAAFTGSDPEDASAGYATNLTGRKVTLASGTNGTVYYNGTAVPTGAGTTITSFNPALVRFDPADGAVSGTFTYNVFDNADKPSATAATVTLPFADITISGTVFDDPNTTAAVDGTATGTIGANTLYAVLLNGTTVVSRKAVAANGTYSFGTADGVTSGSSYTVIVTNGNTAVTPVLAAGTVYNSETDGSVNGSITITNITASVANQNFGIDQLPTVNNYTATTVANPGGTATIAVAAAAFTGSDPEDASAGYATNLTGRKVTLASGTNGTVYYNGTAVPTGAGTTITNFNPALITFDPVNGAVTSTFTYTVFDNADKPTATPATVTLGFSDLTVSGIVYDDPNSNATVDGTATGTIGTNTLYAVLLNGTTVVSRKAVNADGTYSFGTADGVTSGSSYTVIVTNGNTAVTPVLAAGTVYNSETDGSVNGSIAITNITASVSGQNFGIDQLPTVTNYTAPSVANPGGTATIAVPVAAFTGTDPEDGTYGTNLTGRKVALGAGVNGSLYYNGTLVPAGGTIITNFNPALVRFDPNDGAVTGTFTYNVYDNADKPATTPATVSLQFSDLVISGVVYDDPNSNALVDGTATGTIGANTLYAVLLNGTTVVSRKAVAANGTYSFGTADGVTSGSSYSVIITNGNTAVTPVLAAGTVYNSETDGSANGSIAVTNITASVTGQNFGIDQLPTVNNYTATTVANPGGTATIAVAAAAFTGSDPEDASAGYATNLTGRKVTLASGTNGTVYYNGTAVPTGTGTTITSFNPALVTFDPVNGAVTSTFTYTVFDNADKPAATAATVTLGFSDLTISGTVFDDPNSNAIVDGTATGTIGANTLYAVLLNSSNAVVSRKAVAANGTYSFGTADGLVSGSGYSIVVTNGATAVTPVLVNAAYNSETDGSVNGSITVNNLSASIANQNFGIDQLPTVNNYTAASVTNPGGTTTVGVAAVAFTGSDPEDLAYTTGLAGRKVAIGAGVNGSLYYNGTLVPAGGTIVTSFDASLLRFDPIDGAVTGSFTYSVYDNADKPSATPATVSIPFADILISGTVYDDPNSNAVVDGTATGTIGANTLYAVLLNSSNTVVSRKAVAANGTYSFGTADGIISGSNYTIVVTNGNTATTPVLAAGSVYNSETDGTVNGSIAVTNITSSLTNQNFGIDQLPTVNNYTAVSASNPGGTVTVGIPTAAFTGSDPEDLTYATGLTGRKVALSAGVNGSLYYNGTLVPAGGVIITSFDPTLVRFDPNTGTVTGSFTYNAYDNADKPSATPATISLPFADILISGTVYDDPNSNALVDGTATGTVGANTLYAVLLNGTTVVSRKAVAANGTYLFGLADGIVSGSSYTVIVTNGATAVTPVLLNAAYNSETDGSANGSISITNITADVINQNFGIDQLPAVTNYTAVSVANPGGNNTIAVSTTAFTGSDPEDGTYAANLTGRKVALSAGVNGSLYYNGTLVPAGGTIINNFNPALVSFDPNTSIITGSFTYNVYDNADKPSATPATVTLPFSDITISGIVYNDANNNGAVDGTATGTIGSNTLYAVLLNGSTVVSRKVVNPDGTYSFGTPDGLIAGGNYTILITNSNTAITPILTGAVYNSETDGSANGTISLTNVTTDIPNQNFGIDQLPTAIASTLGLQLNPGGTNRITLAATLFGGSDPEDGTYPTNLTGRKVNLASVTNGNVYYNGVLVPTGAGTTITNFNPALVSFDPTDGTGTSTFTYSVFDDADKPSTPATVTIPFRLGVTIAGSIWNDVNGDANIDITEIPLTIPATMYANIVSPSGVVLQSVLVTGGTYTSGLVFADSSYTVILTTAQQTAGSLLSAGIMPSGWAATGVNPGASAGTANTANRTGALVVSTAGIANIINRNFGIERIPLAISSTAPAQVNFDPYTQTVVSSSFGGSDFDLGTVQNIRITGFPTNAQTIVVNGITYTSATFPAGGILVPAPLGIVPPNIIAVKPNPGVAVVVIPYVTIDNANVASAGATVTIPYFTILPVTGLELTGIRNGNDVVLKWTTLTEQNTAHFTIERSYNGRDFQTVGTATASGNSNALKSYTTIDRNVLKDVVYYRVTLVDADGKKTVSNTVTIRLSGFSVSNRVFPNPVRDVINIELARAGKYTITLYNTAGQQISVRQVETGSSIITTISRNNLPAGSYILKVLNATAKESESFKLILE